MYCKSIFLLIFHKKRDVPVEYTDTFLGFEPEDTNFALELVSLCSLTMSQYATIICVAQYVYLLDKKATDMFLPSYELRKHFHFLYRLMC